jgi:CheY-like chemotaxis protein
MTEPRPEPLDDPRTVLVVEDEVLIRLAVAVYLRGCGWRVLEAGDAAEAVTILKAADVKIDVVFSDVQMPGPMDGFGLAQWVRTHRPDVRVQLTSGAPAAVAEKAESLCGEVSREPPLAKPYENREVAHRIETMLARAARTSP